MNFDYFFFKLKLSFKKTALVSDIHLLKNFCMSFLKGREVYFVTFMRLIEVIITNVGWDLFSLEIHRIVKKKNTIVIFVDHEIIPLIKNVRIHNDYSFHWFNFTLINCTTTMRFVQKYFYYSEILLQKNASERNICMKNVIFGLFFFKLMDLYAHVHQKKKRKLKKKKNVSEIAIS